MRGSTLERHTTGGEAPAAQETARELVVAVGPLGAIPTEPDCSCVLKVR